MMGANVPINEVTYGAFQSASAHDCIKHWFRYTYQDDENRSYPQTCPAVRVVERTRIETVRVGHVEEAESHDKGLFFGVTHTATNDVLS